MSPAHQNIWDRVDDPRTDTVCTGHCAISSITGFCEICNLTLKEMMDWDTYSTELKLEMRNKTLPKRMKKDEV